MPPHGSISRGKILHIKMPIKRVAPLMLKMVQALVYAMQWVYFIPHISVWGSSFLAAIPPDSARPSLRPSLHPSVLLLHTQSSCDDLTSFPHLFVVLTQHNYLISSHTLSLSSHHLTHTLLLILLMFSSCSGCSCCGCLSLTLITQLATKLSLVRTISIIYNTQYLNV